MVFISSYCRQRDSVELDSEEVNRRALLQKEWSHFRNIQNGKFMKSLDRLIARQKHALKCLREIDEHGLYQQVAQLTIITRFDWNEGDNLERSF